MVARWALMLFSDALIKGNMHIFVPDGRYSAEPNDSEFLMTRHMFSVMFIIVTFLLLISGFDICI